MIALVISLDFTLCLVFLAWIYILKNLIMKQASEFDDSTVSITDFAL